VRLTRVERAAAGGREYAVAAFGVIIDCGV
jgi:hypothetical protein